MQSYIVHLKNCKDKRYIFIMPKASLIEAVYRKLLKEASANITGLAAVQTSDTGAKKEAVIYDIAALEEMLDQIFDGDENVALGAVRGIIRIRKPNHPCDDAWEVSLSAGPGIGKLVYGAAYAMSPSKKLIPDRLSVSTDAERGWKRAEGERTSKELDFLYPPHKTPEKEDDCRRHNEPDKEFLDRAYTAQGWETGTFNALLRAHDEMVKRNGLTPGEELSIFDALKGRVIEFFHASYPE